MVPILATLTVLLVLGGWQVYQVATEETPVSASDPGTDVNAVGTEMEVSIGDAGRMHFVETITFPTARSQLDLSVPRRMGAGADFRPVVSSLVVREPGSAEVKPLGLGDRTTVHLTRSAVTVVLEYDASGVVNRSGDVSTPDRALALVTPLVVEQARRLPAVVRVSSVKVLNVGCLRGTTLVGCGTETADGWAVESSGSEGDVLSDVLAQLNLAVP
ncbi:hypothetical protein FB382_000055 [Nocardioides ginsengisegetis]|uniref:Uncharacterized protein n=1 Tax=Nocardioides ginsengisegetis TaxID=661491 RepID=A0A7W3P7U8_9ACTN|nr:hypothetical protein [Nocardioides ginsengisegetis]MBA8801764.1 hypothetical protein [Nocardioides ginsengisegetis]